MSIRIERIRPRNGLDEKPVKTARGFELADRRIQTGHHHAENATFVRTIDEAAYLVEQGYAIRMSAPGKRASLIAPRSLQVVRS